MNTRKPLVLYIPGYGSDHRSNTYAHLQAETYIDARCLSCDNHDPILAEAQLS